MKLCIIYADAIEEVKKSLISDQVQELITQIFLQDISMKYLDKYNNDPLKALDGLVNYFEEKLSKNYKKYDRAAIKFYLVNELINCNVFPNERCDYVESKQ